LRIHHAFERAEGERRLALAIGFFDGVHRGHREIIRALLRMRRPGERTGALTFENHPASFLRPGSEPPLITTLEERMSLLGDTGIDELYLVRFDAAIASQTAEDFLRSVLIDGLDVRALAIGENFRFGAGRAGDVQLARAVLEPQGREVVAVPSVMDGGERVSSTRVRAALARGDGSEADALLGAPYTLRGRVTFGEGRGHTLGFPTANLAVPPEKTLPMDGVYSAVARHDGRDYPSLVSIGDKPTFGGGSKVVEAWLRDFDRTIYGDELSLRGFSFVRPQLAFDSVDALLTQMQEDATHLRFPSFLPK
jgi:riboflavin kinase/FMN adenylyltransferase